MWELTGILILLILGIAALVAVTNRHTHRNLSRRVIDPQAGRFRDCLCLWPESWLAVQSRDLHAVQQALGLQYPRPCSWLEGFSNADKLFVAPPVKGWTLIIGTDLPSPYRDVDACFRFVLDLSRKLGHVQFFSANRERYYHAWIRAQNGRIVRAYAWAGTTLWHQGLTSATETELGLKCFDYAEPLPEGALQAPGMISANVDKVPILAARWGLDPVSVERHFPLDEQGVAGKAAHHY